MVVTSFPRYSLVERHKEVEQSPCNNHIVIDANKTGHNEHTPTNTCNTEIHFTAIVHYQNQKNIVKYKPLMNVLNNSFMKASEHQKEAWHTLEERTHLPD